MHSGCGEAGPADGSRRFRIGIVCTVRLYRDAFRSVLERTNHLQLVDSGQTADDLIRSRCEVDAVLFDIGGGVDLAEIRRLAAAIAPRPVVGFGVDCVEAAVDCVEAGLAGFLPAEGSVADLVATLEGALNGRLFCSPETARRMAERLAARALERPRRSPGPYSGRGHAEPALTGREREIATLVGEGLSNKEIAKALAISPATVKNHVHIILEKLNVERRARVAQLLQRTGAER